MDDKRRLYNEVSVGYIIKAFLKGLCEESWRRGRLAQSVNHKLSASDEIKHLLGVRAEPVDQGNRSERSHIKTEHSSLLFAKGTKSKFHHAFLTISARVGCYLRGKIRSRRVQKKFLRIFVFTSC